MCERIVIDPKICDNCESYYCSECLKDIKKCKEGDNCIINNKI